jgi:4-amino-4-deoxy-L-arabinose transferase-like glycosyltransferase
LSASYASYATYRRAWIVPVFILLIAAFARLWQFGEAPPGLQHDELFYAQDGRSIIEDGNWRIFYPNNQGREGGYIWLLGATYLMFGATTVMVKIPALWIALLTVAMTYRFARDQFGYRVGVLASGLAAVAFWPVFIGRLGLRAGTLPLVALLVIWGVWRICYRRGNKPAWRTALLTGLVLGFTAYTYTAWFAVFVGFAALFPALALFDRARLKQRWRELALIGGLGLLLALPMLNLYRDGTISQARVSTISRPWDKFKAGDPSELLDNARLIAGIPFFTGDPEWRYNIPGRPYFATPIGLLVYVGLIIVLWQSRRKPINLMLLAMIFAGLIPSLLTTSAPSFLRAVIIYPAMMMFVAIAIDSLARLRRSPALSRLVWATGILMIVITAAVDWPAYFGQWAHDNTVRTIYREDLRILGEYLDKLDEPRVYVSTNAPDDFLDPLLYNYSTPLSNKTQVLWFNGTTDLLLADKPTLLLVSPLAPISPPQQNWLREDYGATRLDPLTDSDGNILFDVYRLGATGNTFADRLKIVSQWPVSVLTPQSFTSDRIEDWATPISLPINFGNVLQLRGVSMPQARPLPAVTSLDGWPGVNMQLYLQPMVSHYPTPISVFVHLLSPDGKVINMQRDFMGVPPTSWDSSVVFQQDHYTGFPPKEYFRPGRYYVTMGAYNVLTGQRLPIQDASGKAIGDRLLLAAVAASYMP